MEKIINWPNTVTLLRLLLILPFCLALIEQNYLIAQILFFIIVIGDGIDGYLSRRLKQETKFGKLFDGLVDTIFLTSALIIIAAMGKIKVTYVILLLLPRPVIFIKELITYSITKKVTYTPTMYRRIIAVLTALLIFASTLMRDINNIALGLIIIIYATLAAESIFSKTNRTNPAPT